jgi:3-hydroxybutyryl-CoA dehydratase
MQPGDALPPLPVGAITRERMVAIMGVMGDPNPIHEDVELARRLGFRGIVNQGPANMAYVANLLLQLTGGPAGIRRLDFRFHDNVVPGDELTARGTVTAVRGTEIDCDFRLEGADGRVPLTGAATVVLADA